MSEEEKLSKEQRVMRAMRKTLGIIIRETTPQPGMHHVLSDQCIEDMRQCLSLIAAREREIAEALGLDTSMRPKFGYQAPSSAKVVPISSLSKTKKPSKD